MRTGPRIFAPAPIKQSSSITGTLRKGVRLPPIVTCWAMYTFLPMRQLQ